MNKYVLNVLISSIPVILLWGIWEILHIVLNQGISVLPPPSVFLRVLIESNFKIGIGSQASSLTTSIFSSALRVLAGLALASILAICVAVLIKMSKVARFFLMPIIQLLSPIAPIAWIPIALVLFGIGNQTAIFVVVMGVFFIFTIAAIRQIETVPENRLQTAQLLGANRFQIWRYVIMPSILPALFTTIRINFMAAWMAVLAAEMTGLRDGLGAIIMTGRNLFDYNLIMIGMFFIGIMGFVLDKLLIFIQKRWFWWDET